MRRLLYDHIADNENPSSLGARYRRRRFALFLRIMQPGSAARILDVGGSEITWKGTGLEANVTLLNTGFRSRTNPFRYVEGDGCAMPMLTSQSFDLIYSNSVIEHVGGWDRQREFAREVIRVAKAYWIQTPSRHFPIEPHVLFPLFQYLPRRCQQFVVLRWPYSHFRQHGEDAVSELSRLRLLSARELALLFPEGQLLRERVAGLTKSLITYKPSTLSGPG